MFLECLSNNAPFETGPVAKSLFRRYGAGKFAQTIKYHRTLTSIWVSCESNPLALATNKFIIEIYSLASSSQGGRGQDVMYALSASEIRRRSLLPEVRQFGRHSNLTIQVKIGDDPAEVSVDE